MGRTKASLSYSHGEWSEGSRSEIQQADQARFEAVRVRGEAGLLIEDRYSRTVHKQKAVKVELGERLKEIEELTLELKHELKLSQEQTEVLMDSFQHLEFVYGQTKRPLTINLQCLNIREEKVDIEKVNDVVETSLKKEVDTIRDYQGRIKILKQLIEMQLFDCQEKQEAIKMDIGKKEAAFEIDQKCHILHERSLDLRKQNGVEKVEPDASNPTTWLFRSREKIKESVTAREVSEQLILDVDSIIEEIPKDLLTNWNRTNKELKQRISETLEIQKKLKSNVKLIDKEILETNCLVEHLRRAKAGKDGPLKLAHSRLSQRTHRPEGELCYDPPHHLLVEEVNTLTESIELIDGKIKEAEAAGVNLEESRRNLERDIRLKERSADLDQSRCLTLRQHFPFTVKCSVICNANLMDRRRYRLNAQV